MGQTRKLRRHGAQAGGRWLAEGADGCVFSAPNNWPCESPKDLPAYDPEDTSVVTKIVATDDFEEDIFRLFPVIRKKYRLQNLPDYIGTCKPRATRFVERENKKMNLFEYFRELNRQGKTRKGCRAWAANFQAGKPRKMYVLRKYNMTFSDYKQQIKELGSPHTMARLFARQAPLFHHTLSVLATGSPYQVIHYDMHSKNIVLFPKKGMTFDPLNGNTFEIGPADFGRALWRDVRKPITPETWDVPYYDQFLSRTHAGRYSEFSQFSLENRLFAYIASHLDSKGSGTWLERWAADRHVQAAMHTSQDPLYWALPTLLSVFPASPRWRSFEEILERLVRLLSEAPTNRARAAALHGNPSMRRFFDKLKARSMFPVAFGLFLRNSLECCGLEKEAIAEAMQSPKTRSLIPAPLHAAFALYWRALLTIIL